MDVSTTVPQPKMKPALVATAYATSGRSVVKDAEAVGVSPSVATRRLGNLGAVEPMSSSGGTVIDSWCTAPINGDAGNAHATGCVTRYLLHVAGDGDWYISDDMEALGRDNDWFDEMKYLRIAMTYPNGNQVHHWIPNGQQGTNCHDISVSATWEGVGFTSNSTVCGGTMYTDVKTSSSSGLMGTHWLGGTDEQVGMEPIDEVYNQSWASLNSTLHLRMNWGCAWACP